MTAVNGESGFTQLQKLNVLEKLLIDGVEVTTGGLIGPGSAIDDNFVSFDGVTATLTQDSGQNTASLRGENNIFINSAADLALHAPVSGGFHVLQTNKQYIQGASFSISQGIQYSAGAAYNSSSTLNVLTYTGSGAVLKSTDNDLTTSRITIVITGAGTLFDFTDTTGTKIVSLESSRMTAVKGNGATIGNIGATTAGSTITSGAVLFMGFDNPITFDGTVTRISYDRCLFLNCNTVFELEATLTVSTGDINNCTFVTDDVADEVWVDNGATITTPIKITGCSTTGPGSFNNSSLNLDADYILTSNTGFTNTELAAQGNIIGNATATTIALGEGAAVAVNFNSLFVPDIQKQFTISSAGLFTYTGSETRIFYSDATLFASTSGGATRDFVYLWRKNTSVISSSSTQAQYNGSNPGSSSCKTLVELATNDTMQLFVYQLSGTLVDPTIETSSMSMVSV